MSKYSGLEGLKFYRLTLIEGFSMDGVYRYRCVCDCGKEVVVKAHFLKESGKTKPTKSCGCYRTDSIVNRSTKHGFSKRGMVDSEYTSWNLMKDRCNNKNNKRYSDYGGRGISICERWESFENFIEDMGKKPSSKHSIDRIDNTKGYSKENCKWATKSEQGANKRIYKNNITGHAGVHYDKSSNKWRAQIRYGGKGHTIGRYETIEEAINARLEAEEKYFGRVINR